MYKKLLIGMITAFVMASASASSCTAQYYAGKAPQIMNPAMQKNTSEICKSGFTVMHSGLSKTPLWSAEHLTKDRLSVYVARTNSFHVEPSLQSGMRAELDDYERSGYDRGHMAPSADMPDEASQHESFSLANMIPQNANNNRGVWAGIEAAVRHETVSRGELYVITGPMFIGNVKAIGPNHVLVPTHIFKVVYDPRTNEAGAYLVENKAKSDVKVLSILQIEQMAKIKLLPTVSDKVKSSVMRLPGPTKVEFTNSKTSSMEGDIVNLLQKLQTNL